LEGTRKKLLIGFITVVIVLMANVALWVGINSYEYKGIPNAGPWTPLPTSSATITEETVDPQPATTSTLLPNSTSTRDPAKNCTHSIAYWNNHPDLWPDKVTIGNYSYTKDAIASVFGTPSDDPATLLFIQLHTAFLNAVNGADYSQVYQTILDAANWLGSHHAGSQLSQNDLQACSSLTTTLEEYNTGKLEPGPCLEEVTPTPIEATPFPETATSSPTTFLYIPVKTPTNTPGSGQPHPHNPPKNTNPPPTQPPPTQAPPPPTTVPTSVPPTHPPPTSVPPTQPLPTPAPKI
jgi:hypothetical protein